MSVSVPFIKQSPAPSRFPPLLGFVHKTILPFLTTISPSSAESSVNWPEPFTSTWWSASVLQHGDMFVMVVTLLSLRSLVTSHDMDVSVSPLVNCDICGVVGDNALSYPLSPSLYWLMSSPIHTGCESLASPLS